jgi:hypothetical protein
MSSDSIQHSCGNTYEFDKNRGEAAFIFTSLSLHYSGVSRLIFSIGKKYEMEKILGDHNAAGTNQHTKKEVRCQILTEPPFDDTAYRTRERLSEEYNIH